MGNKLANMSRGAGETFAASEFSQFGGEAHDAGFGKVARANCQRSSFAGMIFKFWLTLPIRKPQ